MPDVKGMLLLWKPTGPEIYDNITQLNIKAKRCTCNFYTSIVKNPFTNNSDSDFLYLPFLC